MKKGYVSPEKTGSEVLSFSEAFQAVESHIKSVHASEEGYREGDYNPEVTIRDQMASFVHCSCGSPESIVNFGQKDSVGSSDSSNSYGSVSTPSSYGAAQNLGYSSNNVTSVYSGSGEATPSSNVVSLNDYSRNTYSDAA